MKIQILYDKIVKTLLTPNHMLSSLNLEINSKGTIPYELGVR